MAGIRVSMKCSWCGDHYGYRYGWDGNNVFVLTWDFLTFFWFWWHPHFCSNSCKLKYKKNKGETGIQRDIEGIKSVVSFFKNFKSPNDEDSHIVPSQDILQEPQKTNDGFLQISSQDQDTMNNKIPEENASFIPEEKDRTKVFRDFIQAFIEVNGEQTFGKRVHWKNIPEKIAINASNRLKIPDGESMMMILDASLFGSGKEGMAITDWGIRYNDGVDSWVLNWDDLHEKYSLVTNKMDGALGIKGDALLLKAKSGDDFTVDKTINLSMVSISYDILAKILKKACCIFKGSIKKETNSNVIAEEVQGQNINEPKNGIAEKSDNIFDYLRENDRIYVAKKFSERKGFFKRILPSSWILTIVFYLLSAFIIIIIASFTIPSGNEDLIIGLLTFIIPVISLVIGIKKKIKYMGEKKKWKECTESGKKDFNQVFKQFQEMKEVNL
jgi:hypothetical protein